MSVTPVVLGSRFWSRVNVTEDDCWEWTGFLNRGGYGQVKIGGRSGSAWLTHRAVWAITYGDPGDLCVLHHCDNRPCCNPLHLWLGTKADNNADMRAKGRENRALMLERLPRGDDHPARRKPASLARGRSHGNAIDLSAEQAAEIARRMRAGEKTARVCDDFGISPPTAFRIRNGEHWLCR